MSLGELRRPGKTARGSIRLGEIAFSESGDKGSSANIAVFARVPNDHEFLRAQVTADGVKNFFQPLGVGQVVCYEVPNALLKMKLIIMSS